MINYNWISPDKRLPQLANVPSAGTLWLCQNCDPQKRVLRWASYPAAGENLVFSLSETRSRAAAARGLQLHVGVHLWCLL